MNYKLLANSTSIFRSDGAYIPADPANTDYVEYLAWLAEGNTPDPADPPPAPDYKSLRHDAYQKESDPIFFKWQRAEATQQDWLDKVAEIKARFPELQRCQQRYYILRIFSTACLSNPLLLLDIKGLGFAQLWYTPYLVHLSPKIRNTQCVLQTH